MITNDMIYYYEDRANLLRNEITTSIIDLLKENGLTEIRLSKCQDKQPWVAWFNRQSYGYDSRVTKVALHGKGISVEVYDEDCCSSATLTSDDADLACTNVDWLIKILEAIRYTLTLPKSEGIIQLDCHAIEWSYIEPGLSELPESEQRLIVELIRSGDKQGSLYYTDDEDTEYEGEWEIKQN